MARKTRKPQGIARRVSLVMSDSYHRIHLMSVKIKVTRAGKREDGTVLYSGAVQAKYDSLVAAGLIDSDRDFVGALIADDTALNEGFISWVQDTIEDPDSQ